MAHCSGTSADLCAQPIGEAVQLTFFTPCLTLSVSAILGLLEPWLSFIIAACNHNFVDSSSHHTSTISESVFLINLAIGLSLAVLSWRFTNQLIGGILTKLKQRDKSVTEHHEKITFLLLMVLVLQSDHIR